jgi:hypothetical protein
MAFPHQRYHSRQGETTVFEREHLCGALNERREVVSISQHLSIHKTAMSSGNATSAEVFLYTGEGGTAVPRDVVRVRVDPSVTSIPAEAFNERRMLTEVELCEGLVEIGEWSFGGCDQSISHIVIPNSLRRIFNSAFYRSLRASIRLHDGIESIGEYAFASCIFTNFSFPKT